MITASCSNYPDCLAFTTSGAVTNLVSDTSTIDTLIQTITIYPSSTCSFINKHITKIIYPNTIIAKYSKYTGSGCDYSGLNTCPNGQWYFGSSFVTTCFVETIVNNGPGAASEFTVYLGNAYKVSYYIAISLIAVISFMI